MFSNPCANTASAPQLLLDSCLQAMVQSNAALQSLPRTLHASREIHRALLVRRLPASDHGDHTVEVRIAVDNQVRCAATSHALESTEKAPEPWPTVAAAGKRA
ncbi:hypothetical protein LPJ55_000682 [Coemansia sp. RSA 990]|nr:hypothetical protein LPJ55_000682 [Coemansia sp. RSA 990]